MSDHIRLKPITVEEVAEREALEGAGREIINGEWVEDNEMASKKHGRIGARLVAKLVNFIDEHPLGEVYQDNTTYVLEGTRANIITLRIPDLSFIRTERAVSQDEEGHLYIAPDLAVEIVSATEKAKDTDAKIRDYLHYGTRQVWVIHPDIQQISVHLPDGTTKTYTVTDTLTGGDVLPEFELIVASLFS